MTTPAGALAEILEVPAQNPRTDRRFLTVVVEGLNLSGVDAEIEALVQLSRLVRECYVLVERLPTTDAKKAKTRALLDPFGGLRDLTFANHTVSQMANPVLMPVSIDGLHHLDLILEPHFGINVDSGKVNSALNELRSAIDAIKGSDLPEPLRSVSMKRILQAVEAAEHFSLFGQDELQARIDALIGQLVVSQTEATGKTGKILRRAARAAMMLSATIIAADATGGALLGLEEKAPKLLEYFGPLDD